MYLSDPTEFPRFDGAGLHFGIDQLVANSKGVWMAAKYPMDSTQQDRLASKAHPCHPSLGYLNSPPVVAGQKEGNDAEAMRAVDPR